LGRITVPPGFTLTKKAPATIGVGSNGMFSVQLDSSIVGTNSGNITINNNDPTDSPFSFPVTGSVTSPPPPPQMQVFAGTNAMASGQSNVVDFGSVEQNMTGTTVTFTVTNSGGQTLDLKSVAVPSGFTLTKSVPATMGPGSDGTFSVQLDSGTIGTSSGNITINNNDPTNGAFSFPISGTVTGGPAQANAPESTNDAPTARILDAPRDSQPKPPDNSAARTVDTVVPNTVPTPGPPGSGTGDGTGSGNGTGSGSGAASGSGNGSGSGSGAGAGSGNGAGTGSNAGSPSPTAPTTPPPPADSLTNPPTSTPPPAPEGHGGIGGLTNQIPSHIFDLNGPASNVVFVLDHSLSMKSNHKSAVARRELLETLESMSQAQKFYILFFHSGGYEAMPAPGPVDATPDNINAITNWLFSVGHKFGSDPTKAVKRALDLLPPPDTVWLLSDGKFSSKAAEAIRDANGPLNVHINTIGFYSSEGEQVLHQIADENRGIYRFVPPPNPAANAPVGNAP
jgi:hypothetical protein